MTAASAMSNEEKIAVFERLLESSMSGDGRLAIQILEKTEEHLYADSVVAALADVDNVYAPSLLGYLLRIDPSRALKMANEVLKSSVLANRRSAALALGQLGTHEAVRVLARLLSDEDSQNRISACRALVRTHATGVVEDLAKPVLDDPVRDVRRPRLRLSARSTCPRPLCVSRRPSAPIQTCTRGLRPRRDWASQAMLEPPSRLLMRWPTPIHSCEPRRRGRCLSGGTRRVCLSDCLGSGG